MTAPSILQLTAPFSALPESRAAALLADTHGLVIESIERLATERDDTFRVRTAGRTVVAKFAHPLDDPAALLEQVTVLDLLARHHPDLPVHRVVPCTDGSLLCRVDDESGQARVVRVLGHLDGELVGSAARPVTMMHPLGALHARLAHAIAAIGDAARPPLRGATTPWNLVNLEQYAPLAEQIADDELRAETRRVIERVTPAVLPRTRALPAVLAHNDLHGDNVLVRIDPFAITGVLDFGDMTRTPLVADLAIAASYARGRVGDAPEPWAAARAYVAGYESVHPLSADEHLLLPQLVLLRLAQRGILNSAIADANPAAQSYAGRNLSAITRDLRELGASIPSTIGARH